MKTIQRIVHFDSKGDKEIEYLVDNVFYTTEHDSYSLPQVARDYLAAIDFDALKEKILIRNRYSQEYVWPEVAVDPPEKEELYFGEDGILLATNIVSKDAASSKGYKLYLLSDSRIALFSFSELSGCGGAGSSSGRTSTWNEYNCTLEKTVMVSQHGVCVLSKE